MISRTIRQPNVLSVLFLAILTCVSPHLVNGDDVSMFSDTTPRVEVREGDDQVLQFDLLSPYNGLSKTDHSTLTAANEAKETTFKEFNLKSAEETERSKASPASNPSVDEIISGIIQLIGGNVKLGRPPPPQPPQFQNMQDDFSDFHGSRINNRAPPKVTFIGPPSILIGPGPPAGLPLPLSPYHKLSKPSLNGIVPIKGVPESDITSLLGQAVKPLPKDNQNGADHGTRRVSTSKVMLKKPSLPSSATLLVPHRVHAVSEQSLERKPVLAAPVHDQLSEQAVIVKRVEIQPSHINYIQVSNDSNKLQTSAATEQLSVISASEPFERSQPEISITSAVASSQASDPVNAVDNANGEQGPPDGPITEWIPVHLASGLRPTKTWTEEAPAIITAPDEGPSVFDITIKHKIGADLGATTTAKLSSSISTSSIHVPTIISTPVANTLLSTSTSAMTATAALGTTSTAEIRDEEEDDVELPFVVTKAIVPTSTSKDLPLATTAKPASPSLSSKRDPPLGRERYEDVVYGKPAVEANRPIAPSVPEVTLVGSGVLSTQTSTATKVLLSTVSYHKTPANEMTGLGRPFIVPVDVDEGGVKPHMGRKREPVQDVVTETDKGHSVYIDGRPTHFKIRPNAAGPTLQVGSGVTVNAAPEQPDGSKPKTLLPNNPGPPPKPSSVGSVVVPPRGQVQGQVSQPTSKAPTVRRPPFRPRPQVPLVRIDTCIVGDDTTCDMRMNEKCKTELGISSCQCKPGFGRTTARGMCSPIASFGVSVRVDKLGETKLGLTRNYINPNSEDYQFLEYESIQGLSSMFALSRLAKVFMGAKINKFYTIAGKMVINATIELEMNNATKASTIKRVLQQELSRIIAVRNNNLGDSQLWVESSVNAVPRVDDINECSNPELHDCSQYARCINDFGGFRCACKSGYEDKFEADPKRSGRICASCSPQYCTNRGECVVERGEKTCKCRGNFIGSRCDIDGEVLGVAIGGSVAALVIIIVTFLCLYMWNQRWKSEQQKMEAMSAASAQTFSYVNKQQQVAGYRYAIDDRYRWAQMQNEAANYYANPEHLIGTSQQHVYATPSRVQTPDDLLADDMLESRHYSRPMRQERSKSRNSTIHGHYQTATLPMGPGSIYNETEFSTRETLYTPSHLIVSPRSKYAVYS